MTQVMIAFSNSYARLPENFYARLSPTPVAEPHLVKFNRSLAEQLGLDPEDVREKAAAYFSGNLIPEGAEPIAMAYAGHQFGGFVPQLGDGRAILLGEIRDRQGIRRDVQLKGSGPTPFSRRGDGRAALGPVLREYLVSEAMHALGIPTTRALAVVTTGEKVYREQGALPGAVLTRIASSHIRVGTFEYLAARGDVESVRRLADYVIERHDPDVRKSERPYLALLDAVIGRQAGLVAKWLHVGFIHGVMNTDNTAVSGETIDFGPCAFMDTYDPASVFSSIDHSGRYAFANQPRIAQWNLARFAETLVPLLDDNETKAVALASEAIARFPSQFETHWLGGMRRKIGLHTAEAGDLELINRFLDAMHKNAADYTLTFRRLCDAAADGDQDVQAGELFADPGVYRDWAVAWRARLAREPVASLERKNAMCGVNPAFIPRNHHVENALEAAVDRSDFGPFEELFTVLGRPYEDQEERAYYGEKPPNSEGIYRTFCGT